MVTEPRFDDRCDKISQSDLMNRFRGGQLDFRMDVKSLSELLKGTIDPTVSIELKKNLITFVGDNNSDNKVRNEAEKKLAEVHKIIGFGPVLLQVSQF